MRDDPRVVTLVTRASEGDQMRGTSLLTAMEHLCIQSAPGAG